MYKMADKDKLLIRKFMKEISDNISQNELETLKYLCGIESSIAASITKAYQVFDILEKRGILYNSYIMLKVHEDYLKMYQPVLLGILTTIKIQ